ncbi:MAG: hypothetical protein K1060chlam1_01057 [Candidatus Anoxychlamydiales bacterium]|nr:hypothetical protein [Candidatus Anoxychlamydiales bacterium]
MATISFTTIPQSPGPFSDTSLPKGEQRRFCVIEGKIVCPIENNPLEEGTVGIIARCCQSVFGNGFLQYIKENQNCFYCKREFDFEEEKFKTRIRQMEAIFSQADEIGVVMTFPHKTNEDVAWIERIVSAIKSS